MGIIASAKAEMERAGFDAEDVARLEQILELFFDQWDSGGAVHVMAPILMRCIAGKPLSPLTGDDDEWMEVADGVFQNIRCSSVFKQFQKAEGEGPSGWATYDIETPGRPLITFPYYPDRAEVASPVIEFTSA